MNKGLPSVPSKRWVTPTIVSAASMNTAQSNKTSNVTEGLNGIAGFGPAS